MKLHIKQGVFSALDYFLAHRYTITDESGLVMSMEKQLLSIGGTFVIDLRDEEHVMEALGVVFAIDRIVDQEQEKCSGNGWKLK